MTGTLYIVPTPIGNLGDITLRAIETLKSVDFIAAEDTRVGGKLLMLLEIKKPLVSYHEHSKGTVIENICHRIINGESCALITDAGTPAVSDPGQKLVAACAERQITVCALPGPCAAVTAISASGLDSRRFCFEGFLPENNRERRERIAELAHEPRCFVIYVSPHDIEDYLEELANAFGNRQCVLSKELTKMHEKHFRGSIAEVYHTFKALPVQDKKGEYALVCQGKTKEEEIDFWADMTVNAHVEHYISMGMSKMDACKQVARDRGVGKSEIYKLINKD